MSSGIQTLLDSTSGHISGIQFTCKLVSVNAKNRHYTASSTIKSQLQLKNGCREESNSILILTSPGIILYNNIIPLHLTKYSFFVFYVWYENFKPLDFHSKYAIFGFIFNYTARIQLPEAHGPSCTHTHPLKKVIRGLINSPNKYLNNTGTGNSK